MFNKSDWRREKRTKEDIRKQKERAAIATGQDGTDPGGMCVAGLPVLTPAVEQNFHQSEARLGDSGGSADEKRHTLPALLFHKIHLFLYHVSILTGQKLS